MAGYKTLQQLGECAMEIGRPIELHLRREEIARAGRDPRPCYHQRQGHLGEGMEESMGVYVTRLTYYIYTVQKFKAV